jgi:hypothetical protein
MAQVTGGDVAQEQGELTQAIGAAYYSLLSTVYKLLVNRS